MGTAMSAVTDRLTHLADALRKRLVRDDHIRPNRLHKLALRHQAVGILDKVAQNLEALRAQLNLAIRPPQTTAHDIERVILELEHLACHRFSTVPGPRRR